MRLNLPKCEKRMQKRPNERICWRGLADTPSMTLSAFMDATLYGSRRFVIESKST